MKILASDFDGTLNFGGIDDRKRNAIAQWRCAGNRFGIISGRNPDDLLTQVKTEALTVDFLIANNGTLILNPDGTVLDEVRGSGQVAASLIKLCFDTGCSLIRIGGEQCIYVRPGDTSCVPGDIPQEALSPLPYFHQISGVYPDTASAFAVAEQVRTAFAGEAAALPNGVWLDIVPHGVDKAQGLRRLIRLLGATEEDLIVVGDSTNDSAMIAAFSSYAMANAEPSVLALADAVTPGVAELIQRELEKQGV